MKTTLIASNLIAAALAATIDVTIGPGLNYSPDSITAAEGDVVSFTFGSGHNVVSGSFDDPCQPDGVIYSGDGSDGDVFSVTINGTDPIWLYCSIPRHCQGGMAMVINPPSDQTLDDYKSAANSAQGSSEPDNVVGGIYGNAAAATSAAASASSSASSESSSASSSASSASSSASAAATSASAAASSAASSAAASATSSGNVGTALDVNIVSGFGTLASAVLGLLALL